MNDAALKACSKCHRLQADTEFYVHCRRCKSCLRQYTINWHAKRRQIAPPPTPRFPSIAPQKDEVERLLSYDRTTGVFTWRERRGGARAGDVAGSVGKKGYRTIFIGSKGYKAHRLAWLLVTQHWPQETINHKNGLKDDNRFDNLEEMSLADNSRHAHRTGLITTDRPRHRGKWVALPMNSEPTK